MNSNLTLGEPSIDRQHYELFHTFQHLMASGITEEALSDILSRLTKQICYHFEAEERFMSSLNLPGKLLRDHQLAHNQIIEDLTQIHLDSMHGLGLPFEEIISTVANCVNHHLVEFDLLLKPYIEATAWIKS